MTTSMIPVTFDGCAGWLHDAPGGRGVILLPAQGFEHLCSRHAFRVLAGRIAAAGLPTLRFDYHGTGDSAGSDLDPDRVATWLRNVEAAIAWMKASTGVTEVALVGLRLGALLALPVAAARDDVVRLALLAPPLSGASYLREMLVLSRVVAGGAEDAPAPDGLTVAGFEMTPPTLAAIRGLDPLAVERPFSTPVLLMAPEGGRAAARITSHLEALGCEVRQEAFSGYQQLMCDPTAAQIPEAALDRVAAWVTQNPPRQRANPLRVSPMRLDGGAWLEAGLRIGPDGAAAGVYCAPTSGAGPHPAVLMLNAGGIYHVGWARMHVAMARRLAAQGVASLRLDLPGTGDAASWPGPRRMTFYDSMADHVRAALDWLEDQGHDELTISGACSGAHHGFHAAVADPRVAGLVLLNTLCFVWGSSYALPLNAWRLSRPFEVASKQRIHDEGEARRPSLIEAAIDNSLPGAKAAVRGVLEAVKTGLAPFRRGDASATAGGNEVERWFAALSARGTRTLLVYSEDDPGRTELERYMGPGGCRATALPGVGMELIAEADHALTPPAARARFAELLEGFVAGHGRAQPRRRQALRRAAAG